MMMDRTAFNGEKSALFCPPSRSSIEERIDRRMEEPSAVSVNVAVRENSDKTVTVTVTGERVADTADDLTITVFIVENDIVARHQAGSGDGYLHQHVNRAVNSTWGVPLVWNGDSYYYECSFELKDIWKRGNMEAVALIGHYNPDNVLECTVENAGHACFKEAGVNGVKIPEPYVTGYYDVFGTPIGERPDRGFYITVYSDGTSKKHMVRQ